MLNQNLFEELTQLLSKDNNFVSNQGLLKNKIMESALKMDANLIKSLLSHEKIKEHFFVKVDAALVFDKQKFIRFVSNKEFLPDSYTSFKNKIGLTINGDYLSEQKEVALAWPYKDCVLEGGQTKGDAKRKEIFYNEILAPDEIDRLLEPKVFANFKRIDVKGEHKVTEIKSDDNLIIKGNNLLVMHSLKKKFAGKVKLIYIDPPYNTGNDEFKYNDNFNHSTWLTFMKNRLEVSRELLSKEGVIFVQISDKEIGYLHVLMDEIFTQEQFINKICVKVRAPTGFKIVNVGLYESAEYILVYGKNKVEWEYLSQYEPCDYDENYKFIVVNKEDPPKDWKIENLLEYVAKKLGFESFKDAIKKFGKPVFISEVGKEALENSDKVFRFTAINEDAGKDTLKAKKESLEKRDKIILVKRKGKRDRLVLNGEIMTFYEFKVRELDGVKTPANPLTNIWTDVAWEGIANEGRVRFNSGKKPEKLIKRIIEMSTKKDDIVLDFFAGTGTTCAVAHKMGRKYIGVEQLNYGENDSIVRLKNVIKGDTTGISKTVNWKGGGDFIYCELKELNESIIEKIQKAKSTKEIMQIWERVSRSPFLSYRVDSKKFDKNINEFEKLSLEDQKRFLMEVLDKNQLYVNLSEIDDKEYNISKEDKELNKKFYSD